MWSSQWISNLSNWNEEAWKKKSGLQRDSNPWPPRYRCDALPTELWSHTLGARSIVSSYFPVKGVKWRVVYEMIHIWTADIYEGDMWSSQWISNLSNWNEEAWKKSGLQRDSNPWPPRYRCDALPTELWSHTLGARSIVSSYFPVKGVKWRVVYEMIHIWTADIYEGDMWSSQWISNLSNWNEEAWKKSGLQRDSNPWPPRYRCDALPTELWSHTLGARSIVSSYFPVKGVKWRVVYEMIHIWTADIYEGDMWSSQWISNLSNWNEEAWKKSGLQRDSNPWPPRYRCDALPTELWSHTLGARSIVSFYFPVKGVKWRVVYEMIHIWTADIYEGDMWSSQWISNLSNWNEKAWKKSGLQRDSNPWPPRYRCDALPTELWSHTLGARSIVSSYFPVKGVKWRVVYEMIHIWTADIYEGDMWSSQWISNLSNWNEEAWKKSGLQRDSNPWPPRYRCDALPTELWSHTLGARSIVSSYFPVKGVKWRVVYEMIHIWTADIYEGDMWSSQWISNLSNWNEEAWKKSGLQRDSNPWPPRYRCDALPTELWSHTLGARSIVSSYFPVKGVKWRVVYEMIHIWTADIYEGDMWSSTYD